MTRPPKTPPPPPAPDPCPDFQCYREIYLANIGIPTATAYRRVKWARSLMWWHKRHCPVCKADHLKTNFNASEPKTLTWRMV